MLDSLYGNTKKLNKDAKNFTNKKKEYELESIKLFYKKIYCKIWYNINIFLFFLLNDKW